MKALGHHILLEMFDCDRKALNNVKGIEKILVEAAKKSGAHIVKVLFHKFNPHGVSGVVVIAESHFTIHTWPEYGYAAVDLFFCGDSMDYSKATEYIRQKVKAKHITSVTLDRGVLNF
ncbi:MAG: adenosylmethionine decarboxylase [Candidatus Edwardsbacteria bacterium]